MNFIPCAKWVKKGVAKTDPDKVQLSQEELQKIINSAREQIKAVEEDEDENNLMEEDEPASSSRTDKYNFKDYDKEDAADESLFSLGKLIVNDEDNEYQLLPEDYDSEEEDEKIKPTDNLIVVGHVDDDASTLEIYVYNKEDGDLYVHHDILLPSIPLCLEWLNYEPSDSNSGNLIAVGSMSCVISVWDLDIVGSLEPAYMLGKFSAKKKHNKSHGHKDAVLDLAWNENYKHILASGSVDQTVLLWDLDVGSASTTFSQFNDKVQSIKWQPNDYHLLLTGSADKTAKLFDCRMTETKNQWLFDNEIEKVMWSPWDNNKMFFGTNNGSIIHYDLRHCDQPVWVIKAHDNEVTGLEMDKNCPDLLFTCSMDETVKIWNVESNPAELKSEKTYGLKGIQCLSLNPDYPFIACFGGTSKKNNFKVVNLHKTLKPESSLEMSSVIHPPPSMLQSTESAFQSLSIKKPKLKSKKKFGHKFKNSN